MNAVTRIAAPEVLYTSRIAGTGGMVEEMQMLFVIYEVGMTANQLHEKAHQALMPTMTESGLKRAIKVFSDRYMVGDTASNLKTLVYKIRLSDFKSLMLLHTAQSDEFFCDFMLESLWVLRNKKHYDYVVLSDAQRFTEDAVHEGKAKTQWSQSTIKSLASSALSICTDYGILRSPVGPRRLFDYLYDHQSSATALYLAYYLHFSGLSDNSVVHHKLWGAMGFNEVDVLNAIHNLAMHGVLVSQSAGGVHCISWKFKSMQEVINELIDRHANP